MTCSRSIRQEPRARPRAAAPERARRQVLAAPRPGLAHLHSGHARQIVLKRLEKGVDVAQCNLAKAPNAGRGRHQDLTQFRDDIRKGLGARFGQVVGAGEVDGDPAGGFRYKVAIQGRQGDVGIFWSYYLVASPEGDQLVAIFTMADSMRESFGDEDLTLIGSLRWKAAEASGTR